MPALPQPTDPTLAAVDTELELRQDTRPRPYLGASILGDPCPRKLWYQFRWAPRKAFDAATLKRFEDGHRGEDLQAERLRLVEGIELWTEDAAGQQFGFRDGHLRGHADGFIRGLRQAPKTVHVWEHKQVGEKKLRALEKAKAEHGEKGALAQWDDLYYAQAQVYMHYFDLTRHYLTCSSPGGRETVSCRTEYDRAHAEAFIQRAKAVTLSREAPERISNDPSFWRCKWCDYAETCHHGMDGLSRLTAGCRMCKAVEPLEAGGWLCHVHGIQLGEEEQREGCDEWDGLIASDRRAA
jgi:CRISPR/Cas system-associated exonuclease Cas4 (RecB family)